MKPKILTSPSSFGQISKKPFDLLEQNGFEVVNNPFGRKLTENEAIDLGKDCIGIVAGVEPLTKRVMDALPMLKCISRVGVGMDNVDIEYARRKSIVVINTPDGPTRAVAELTLAMTLAVLRKIPQADAEMKIKKWNKQIGSLLFEKTIGIIGLGRIGRLVAEMFRALGNPVIGYDLHLDKEWVNSHSVKASTFDETLSSADILTLHLPGNKDKTPIVGKNELAAMKPGAYLINIARGGVIDEEALYYALTQNKLAGAALDVFENEPYSGPFCDLDNVILTPHIGSYAKEGKLKMEIEAVENLINALIEKS